LSATPLKFVVQLLAQPNTLIDRRKGESLAVAIKTGICNEIQLLQKSKRPERGNVRADFSFGRALFDGNYRGARASDLSSQVFLTQLAASPG
jgi:hypothetical protein